MENLTIWNRLTSETPAFWKSVQIGCVVVAAILGWVMDAVHIPQLVEGIVLGAVGGVGIFAQCAVQDNALIKKVLADPLKSIPDIVDALPELVGQMKQIHAAMILPTKVGLSDVVGAVQTIETQTGVEEGKTGEENGSPVAMQPAAVHDAYNIVANQQPQ